ncbi:MAG: HAMP domain-containing histidine kinase [Bacteroidales bacterium]|nr:HAMP domain-containing histidine kinase [Bacteroidales bacterium]
MAISLTGIVVVQYFWIREAIRVKEEQFDRLVNDALNETVKRIDLDADTYFISTKLSREKGYSYVYSSKIDGEDLEDTELIWDTQGPDSLIWSDSASQGIISVNGNNSTLVGVNAFKDRNTRIQAISRLDSLKEAIGKDNVTVVSQLKDSVNVIIERKIEGYDRQNENLKDFIDELVIEIKNIDEPIESRLQGVDIGKRLTESLNNRGIDAEFEFAVYNPEKDSLQSIRSDNFTISGNYEMYSTRLFPEQVLDNLNQLMLYFPGKRGYIIKSIQILLLGSIVFTMVILLTFLFTIRVILKQKKISEIKSDFINNMTHEFKTPIATISLAVDSINNSKIINNPEKIRYYSDIIEEENARMNSKVESVLQMSLIDKNDLNIQVEEFDSHEAIRKVVKNFELRLNQKNGKVNFGLNAHNSVLKTDKNHFVNILSNLLDNAIKYSTESPEITIKTESINGKFYLSVKDNGIGMSKEEMSKIFDKFYRVSTGDIHNIKGFGLGLSYVKAVLLALDGQIKPYSAPGKGSEFTVILPA